MQEAISDSGAGSPASTALPKLPSWSASGWQTLLKQPSAGTANLTDMLADPGQSGEGIQAVGDASASPLFKWTSDGSMMEELMKAYKDSSPGTPTFGGGAPGNSLFRDGSLMRDGSLHKDGSLTSCLQAAFQAQLEEEDQKVGVVSVSESPREAATAARPPPILHSSSEPFAFVPTGAINDSPQLHVPRLNLNSQRTSQPISQHAESRAVQPGYTEPPSLQGQTNLSQQQLQLQQQVPQLQQQAPQLQLPREQTAAADATPQALPVWQHQSQYSLVSQPKLARQLPAQQQPQLEQQQQHLGSIPAAAPPDNHPAPAQFCYPQPQASQLVAPLGSSQALYPTITSAVITSGAMSASMWTKPHSRSGSPALQAQGPPPGSGQQPPHRLQQADGSMQAVPRIVIRTNTPPAAPEASPPSQQYPVVLNSRVVRESTSEPQPSHPPSNSYAHWAQPDQHHLLQGQYGMHQYQQQQQQQQSLVHAQQPQDYMQQALHGQALNVHQQQQQQPQQPLYAAQQLLQQLPPQLPQQLPKQPLQQLPQQEQQQRPRPGSFHELLSAPVLSEECSSASVTHGSASGLTHTRQTQQLPAAQSAAIYSGQVLCQTPTNDNSAVGDTTQLAHQNPGLGPVPSSQHMLLSHSNNASQRQHHQHLLTSSTQLLMQSSAAMYPPVQYPQPMGGFPMLPKTSTGPLPGHPYHGYHPTQPAGAATGAHPPHQQQQQQQQQAFQPYPQAQIGVANLPLQSAMHGQSSGQGQASTLADPKSRDQVPLASAGFATPASHPHMARVQIGGVTYDPPQVLNPAPTIAAAYQASAGSSQYPAHASVHGARQRLDSNPQQTSVLSLQHGRPVESAAVSNRPQGMYHQSQHRADADGGFLGSDLPWGSVQGGAPGPAYVPMQQAGFARPATSAGASLETPGSVASTVAQLCLPGSHGMILLTSHPAAPSQLKDTGKAVSFVAELASPHQEADTVMPTIPSSAKENFQDQRQHGQTPQPGRKFKRDRSSRKNSFSLPPVPPKKHATADAEFSPASSLDFALHGAASAPVPLVEQGPDFPSSLASIGMLHSASCQDMATDVSAGAVAAARTASGGKSSRSSSADIVFCADGIDFNSRAWKSMSRKEKNRASAAASRARREAYTESLEDMVRKLQEEHDWLQEQIEPGSMDKQKTELDVPMLLPSRPPVRHLSL